MEQFRLLLTTTITIAFIHTLIGIDHYIPFVALSKTNGWSMKKTMLVVSLCGIGHVLSSILLGFIGIGLSIGISSLVDIESIRGEIATYFLIAFGLVYMVYGIRRAAKNRTHEHITLDGHTISHLHPVAGEAHEHSRYDAKRSSNVIWGLFVLFVLGPCEPLIPIIMYPAATQNIFVLVFITASFMVCTISTMLLMTFLGLKGISLLKINRLERYSHILAGFAVFACGIAILVLPI